MKAILLNLVRKKHLNSHMVYIIHVFLSYHVGNMSKFVENIEEWPIGLDFPSCCNVNDGQAF